MKNKNEVQEVMDYCECIALKSKLEEQGFIFEIHWTFAKVCKGDKVILDYVYKYPFFPVQSKREELYTEHIIKAVKATKEYLAQLKTIMA